MPNEPLDLQPLDLQPVAQAKLKPEALDLQPVEQAKPKALDLQPLDLQPVVAAAAEAPAKPKNTGGMVWSDITTNKEIDDIAQKHGVDAKTLRDASAFFGSVPEGESIGDIVKGALGSAAQAVAYGVPQKLYKVMQTPQMELALDELDRLAEAKKSTLRSAQELVGGFLTGTAEAKLLGKAAFPVIGAVAGAAHANQGDVLQNAALGAGIGGALGVGAVGLGKASSYLGEKAREAASKVGLTKTTEGIEELVGKKLASGEGAKIEAEKQALKSGKPEDLVKFLGEDEVIRLIEPTSSTYKLIRADLIDQGVKPTNAAIAEAVAENKLQAIRDQIVKRVDAKDWESAIKDAGGIDKLLNETFDTLRNEQVARDIITEGNLGKNLPKIGTLKGLLYKVADNKPLMKIVDKRLGGGAQFSAELAIDDLSSNLAKASNRIKQNLTDIEAFDKMLRKANISREDFATKPLPANIQEMWDGLQNRFVKEAQEKGAAVEQIGKQLQSPVELHGSLQKRINELSEGLKTNITDLSEDEFRQLAKDGAFQEFKRGVDIVSGKTNETARDLTNSIKNIMEDISTPNARLLRGIDNLPDFMVEKDPIKLLENWSANTYQNLATREPVQRLTSIANIAAEAEDAWTAKHLRDTIQDIRGGRKDTIAGGTKQAANKWATYWNSKGQETLAELPEYMSALNRQIYPNMVGGLNLKAQLQNLATPTLSAIPDIGLKDGIRSWWNSLGDVSKLLATKGKAGTEKFLAEKGILPASYMEEAAGLKANIGNLSKANKMSNEALMFMFNLSELTARAQTYFMGQELGQQMAKNPEWAAQFIGKLNSPGYRRTLSQALANGDERALQDQMSKYLNSNHLLNYNKANQSAFGRYVGPTFSAFTKWPTTMLGKVLQELEDKGGLVGSVEVAKKLMAPVVGLAIADRLVRGEEPSERSKKVVGSHLTSMAPFDAIKDVAKVAHPTSNIAGRFGETITQPTPKNGEDHRLRSAVNDVMSTFLPGAGWLKMFGEDIPTLLTNKKPEGYSFERKVNTVLGRPPQPK